MNSLDQRKYEAIQLTFKQVGKFIQIITVYLKCNCFLTRHGIVNLNEDVELDPLVSLDLGLFILTLYFVMPCRCLNTSVRYSKS